MKVEGIKMDELIHTHTHKQTHTRGKEERKMPMANLWCNYHLGARIIVYLG